MRIVFFGTPEFALPSLNALYRATGFRVAAAVTQPDRAKGRGKKVIASPVKQLAQELNIKVLTYENIRAPEAVEELKDLKADLFVTAAYGQILSQKVLDIPKTGTVNVHASLLPKYRGAAPVPWCIYNGERETGVTTMFTDRGVDTGDMLLQARTDIGPDETGGELLERLSHLGAEVLVETLRRLEAGTLYRTPQREEEATKVPMLEKSHGHMDFTRTAEALRNQVRAFIPWPVAWTTYRDPKNGVQRMKVFSVRRVNVPGLFAPGEVLLASARDGLVVSCGAGEALEILEMQMAGAKRMTAREYLRAKSINVGAILGSEAD
ncbi:MAG: methionyl-tRNA formyltransferase [Christensenellales bacterium]